MAQRVERARQAEARKVSRRSFMRVSAFAGLTLFTGAMSAAFLGFFNLRSPSGFGRPVTVPQIQVPAPGADPVRITEGKFWLVNLDGAEGDVLSQGGAGGLMALYWKCPTSAAPSPGAAISMARPWPSRASRAGSAAPATARRTRGPVSASSDPRHAPWTPSLSRRTGMAP